MSATMLTAREDRVIARAYAILAKRAVGADVLTEPEAVRAYLKVRLEGLQHEEFHVAWLDAQNRVLTFEFMFRGTLAQTSVYPREVVKSALAHNAAGCVLAHNHPSGLCEPSRADELLTQKLKETLALVDVRVLDHFIIAPGARAISFAERGLI